MPAQLDRYYTRAEVLAMPEDGNRYELVHGELLVSPSPRPLHQLVAARLFAWLFAYCERTGVGRPLFSPADLSWGLDDILVQPDLFVTGAQYTSRHSWHDLREFPLVVEVLSPSTARYDRFTKRRLYQAMRVPCYWIVDIEKGLVEVWTPDAIAPEYETGSLTWHPMGAEEPLAVDLEALLAP